MRSFLTACAVFLAAGAAGAQPLASRIDSIFAPWNRPDAPGCAVGVNGADSLRFARGYGSANLDYGIPITPQSVFYLASVSKQFTAAAVLLAAEQGHLSLDDDIRKWLPELRAYEAPITVRHLVHHTSGLRDYLTLLPLAGRPYENVLGDRELLELIARQNALNFRPGAEFLYSNTGYVLLAEIVERATGKSLAAYADEQIFRPLGMRNTHFHDDAGIVVPGRVIGYARDSSAFRINHLFSFDKVGDGGLYSTIDDLARWDRAMQNGALGGEGFSTRLLQRGVLSSGDTLPYAFGVVHGEYRGLTTVGHGGALAGFRTMLLRFPEERTTVLVLCNDGSANPTLLARRVAEVVIGERMSPAAEQAPRRPVAANREAQSTNGLPSTRLEDYTGTFASAELGTTYLLEVRDSALTIVRPDRMVPLRRTGVDAFAAITNTGLELRFRRDAAGRISGFLVDAGRVRGLAFELQR